MKKLLAVITVFAFLFFSGVAFSGDVTKFPNGISSMGVPVVGGTVLTTGTVYFVDSNTGSNSYDGKDKNHPFADIDYAIGMCTASKGDVIIVMPGHAETKTAAIALDVAGVTILGLGEGLLKPTLTGNGTIDVIDITGANCTVDNIHFAAPLTDAQTSFINVGAAAGVTLRNISGVGSTGTENVVDCITVGSTGSDDLLIDGLYIHNSTVAVNSFISLEAAASSVTLKNVWCFGEVATAGLIDAAKIDYLFMENVYIGVTGMTKPAATLDSNPEGMAMNCMFAGTHGTLATNAALGNLMRLFEIRVLEETGGTAQGNVIPAVDADG